MELYVCKLFQTFICMLYRYNIGFQSKSDMSGIKLFVSLGLTKHINGIGTNIFKES